MRIFFLLFFFSISFISSAQTRFSFTTGMTLSSFSKDLMNDYGFVQFREDYENNGGNATTEARNSMRAGFYLAAEVDLFLNMKTFIKTGLKFTTTGDSYYFKTDDIEYQGSYGSTTDAKFILRPRIDYLVIPVNLGTQLNDNFSFYGGFAPHMVINNIYRYNRFESKGSGNEVEQEWEREENQITSRRTVVFANIGLTYMDEISNPRIIIDLRINRSLSSIYSDSRINNNISEINSAGLWNIELGMGIAINAQ